MCFFEDMLLKYVESAIPKDILSQIQVEPKSNLGGGGSKQCWTVQRRFKKFRSGDFSIEDTLDTANLR